MHWVICSVPGMPGSVPGVPGSVFRVPLSVPWELGSVPRVVALSAKKCSLGAW